ncbi:MAG TPA: carboxymuconolactone decarboxylase family protein [Candidatus Eisenbacteria bacterium]|nr:carboxymuconolactone decarboxylase family protein [Candidatus Eisenbacteria bacterium]
MPPRIDYRKFAPEAMKAMYGLESYLAHCSLDHNFMHLIKLRASQINGCAFCIDMHWKDARAGGESEQRLYGLDAWRESPYYTDRERAALAWTEAVTLISSTHAPDEEYAELQKHYSEQEILDLVYAISVINAWNRIAIATRAVPGHYQPPQKSVTAR